MRKIRLALILKVYDRPMTLASIHGLYNQIYTDDKMMGHTCKRLMEELRLEGKVTMRYTTSICGNHWSQYKLK